MNKKELLQNIGGISQTSKMPCSSWSLSAFWCKNGSKLNLIKNNILMIIIAFQLYYNVIYTII